MRLSDQSKKVIIVFITVIGGISSFITLFTISVNSINLYIGIGIILLTALVVIVIGYVMPKDNLPEGMDAISEVIENQKPILKQIKIVFPCDSRYFQAANKLAKEKFGKNSVSRKTVNDWKKKNHLILTCLSDNNRMVGYFDILPLTNNFANKLIVGEVGEKDIKAEHILNTNEMKKAEYLYFAGMAVQNTKAGPGFIHGTYLTWASVLYIKLFYSSNVLKKILTIPTSSCGLDLVKRFNFILEREGPLRNDGFDLYSLDFHAISISRLIEEKASLYKRYDVSDYYKFKELK